MTVRRALLLWGAMLGLLALELGAMAVGWPGVAPVLGLAMVAIVVAGPMRIRTAPPLAWVFALAAGFWLVFALFSLGTLDPLTRHQLPSTLPSSPGSATGE